MKSFIVYDVDGAILRTGSCKDDDLAMQAGAGSTSWRELPMMPARW